MNTIQASLKEVAEDQQLVDLVDEITAHLQSGGSLNIDEYIAAHPEYAERLRNWATVITAMTELGHSLAGVSPGRTAAGGASLSAYSGKESDRTAPNRPAGDANGHITGVLGDFRIVGELGRGGMGVVYEAEQISLGRRVALKVLPFAAMLDKQQLARFKNEARAAATLDHPNIVAIYSVGCERGVHYYAMHLVEGRSLAQVVQLLRAQRDARSSMLDAQSRKGFADQPPATSSQLPASSRDTAPVAALSTLPDSDSREYYRSAARMGIQAAEALDHAHQNGVLHRDVKPANLLVDDAGKLWITDFGLARIEANAGMTMTGDLLGTLRYMSPEQVLGNRGVVDHRSDIYSLGVTLYELLTQQSAFTADSSELLLRQVLETEPAAPRSLNKSIPIDLETIVLKAMRKEAAARYATAQALADDLGKFLAGRPIVATRPTRRERLVAWSRRHAALMRIASLCCFLLCVSLASAVALLQRANQRTMAALARTSELLYEADMSAAYQALEKGWYDETQRLLKRQEPQALDPDRRGLEWHLLKTIVAPPASLLLAGHSGPVTEIATFPDGRKLASVGEDGTLRIWNTATGHLLQTIRVTDKPLISVAVSPDGRYVATASTSVFLCDLAADNSISEISRGDVNVESMAFSSNGRNLAVGARYDGVRFLALDGELIRRIPCYSRVESLEYVSGQPTLLIPNRRVSPTSERTGIVQLWSDDLLRVTAELDVARLEGGSQITVARSSMCGEFVACGERYRSTVVLMDRQTGRVLAQTPASRDRLVDLAYAPDGSAIAAGYQNGQVECFGIQRNEAGVPRSLVRQRIVDAHQGEVTCLRFVDESSLVTSGTDGLIRRWDLSTQAEHSIAMSDCKIGDISLSPSGSRLLVASPTLGGRLVDVDGAAIPVDLDDSKQFSQSVWAAGGSRFALIDDRYAKLDVYDQHGDLLFSRDLTAPPRRLAMSPDGAQVAVVDNMQLTIYSTADGRELEQRALQSPGEAVAYSHGGQQLAYSERAHGITVLQLAADRRVTRMPVGSCVKQLAFAPGDATIASGHSDSTIRLWDVASGRPRGVLVGHEQVINDLAFSEDGRSLLSSSEDGTLRIWSTDSGREYGIVYRTEPGGNCIFSFAAVGRRLAATDGNLPRSHARVLVWAL